MQIAAIIAFWVGIAIAVVAAFADWGDSSADTSWWILLAPLAGLVAFVLYIASGYVASRVARDGRGWLMLIAGPFMLGILASAISAVAAVLG